MQNVFIWNSTRMKINWIECLKSNFLHNFFPPQTLPFFLPSLLLLDCMNLSFSKHKLNEIFNLLRIHLKTNIFRIFIWNFLNFCSLQMFILKQSVLNNPDYESWRWFWLKLSPRKIGFAAFNYSVLFLLLKFPKHLLSFSNWLGFFHYMHACRLQAQHT